MTAFALMIRDDGDVSLVVRRHDLSGCDYEGVLRMPRSIADEIERRGMAFRQDDAIRGIGYPGVVTMRSTQGDCIVQVRADIADPTTVIAEGRIDAFTADACVGRDPVHIGWVVEPGR